MYFFASAYKQTLFTGQPSGLLSVLGLTIQGYVHTGDFHVDFQNLVIRALAIRRGICADSAPRSDMSLFSPES